MAWTRLNARPRALSTATNVPGNSPGSSVSRFTHALMLGSNCSSSERRTDATSASRRSPPRAAWIGTCGVTPANAPSNVPSAHTGLRSLATWSGTSVSTRVSGHTTASCARPPSLRATIWGDICGDTWTRATTAATSAVRCSTLHSTSGFTCVAMLGRNQACTEPSLLKVYEGWTKSSQVCWALLCCPMHIRTKMMWWPALWQYSGAKHRALFVLVLPPMHRFCQYGFCGWFPSSPMYDTPGLFWKCIVTERIWCFWSRMFSLCKHGNCKRPFTSIRSHFAEACRLLWRHPNVTSLPEQVL